MGVYDYIEERRQRGDKMFVVLIDPDKFSEGMLDKLSSLLSVRRADMIFVGGSLVMSDIGEVVKMLKSRFDIPVVLFPGSAQQFTEEADALLFLSLITGRNAEYLIGQHVMSSVRIKRSGVEVIPTGYMLVEGGVMTSVEYISGTQPLPRSKDDIAVATAVAGELLGLKMLYLEAGSGAKECVPESMIRAVRSSVGLPIIVGGGLRSIEDIDKAYSAGADIVVVGTAIEKIMNSDVEIR
jgi:putative glycerol-1-phosphate prenyltransferase